MNNQVKKNNGKMKNIYKIKKLDNIFVRVIKKM